MNLKEHTQKQDRQRQDNLRKVNLLALVLNFEKYWQSYSLSDGILYAKQVREEAHKIVPLFYKVYGNKAVVDQDGRVNNVDLFESRRFIMELNKWLSTKDKFPKVLFGREYTNSSQFLFQYVFMELESQLQQDIGLPVGLSLAMTPHENYFRRLVLVADIRRSQDLITYGLSPDFYREQMIGFLDEVRKILRDNYGIYDRFTGDGFIAYFNQYVCEQEGRDYYEMTLDACEKIQSFSKQYFDNWSNQIRKIPVEPIGLSLGIDSGVVSFKDIEGQFFAIGDACVWATRMCNAGKRGEIIFNNIPYHKIAEYGKEGFCNEIDSVTKNGESFKAYSVNPSLVTYKTQPKKDPSLDRPAAIS